MKNSSKMLFIMMTMMSTVTVISSSSWINMWIGMEMNLMSFIPLNYKSKNSFLTQSMMMYFLTQSMASMCFMMIILTNKHMFMHLNSDLIKTTIMITMMMKMGMPPFHMWLPEIMIKMEWSLCFMIMTWQKIAPMYIMSSVIYMNKTLTTLICMSAVVGAIGGLNQTSTRKIMAYSSITHMSWMITCAATFKKSWLIYMMMYTLLMMVMCMLMHTYNIMYINQLNIFFKKKMNKINIIMLMLSMGGLPPFLGFMPKWITIQYMISSKEMMMMLMMMMSSLITLSYYMRMSLSINLIMSQSQKWLNMLNINNFASTLIFSMNTMLPVIVLATNFY